MRAGMHAQVMTARVNPVRGGAAQPKIQHNHHGVHRGGGVVGLPVGVGFGGGVFVRLGGEVGGIVRVLVEVDDGRGDVVEEGRGDVVEVVRGAVVVRRCGGEVRLRVEVTGATGTDDCTDEGADVGAGRVLLVRPTCVLTGGSAVADRAARSAAELPRVAEVRVASSDARLLPGAIELFTELSIELCTELCTEVLVAACGGGVSPLRVSAKAEHAPATVTAVAVPSTASLRDCPAPCPPNFSHSAPPAAWVA